jgi:RND family efflux transporter MFP subunit
VDEMGRAHKALISHKSLTLGLGMMLAAVTPTSALEFEGYTEPYRSINVAAEESGIVDEVLVREGEIVEAGQPLVRLNNDVHEALLAIAKQSMQAMGRLDAAKADLQLRRERLERLTSLRVEGHARQEEVDRAAAEAAVAEANLRATQEDSVTRRLEYEKIKAQMARRTVRAPMAGVVTTMHTDQGEFLAPNNPVVLTLVQIDSLLANFTLTGSQAETLTIDQEVDVRFVQNGTKTTGAVEFISPVTDAESGTVLVRVRVANSDLRFRSGARCTLSVGK